MLNQLFLLLFSEKCSFMKSAVLFIKSAVLSSEKHNSMKSATLFSEKCNSMKSAVPFSEKHNFMKSATLFSEKHSAFHANFMSFRVITKYRSFFRKTKNEMATATQGQSKSSIDQMSKMLSILEHMEKIESMEKKTLQS